MLMTKAELSPIIKEVWASKFYKDLEVELGVSQYVNRDYEGEVNTWGDTVHIPEVTSDTDAEILTSDNQPYNDGETAVGNIDLIIQKKAVKSIKITDWARYISNPAYQDQVRNKIRYKIMKKMEESLISGMVATTNDDSGNASIAITDFTTVRKTLNDSNVPNDGTRVCFMGSTYMKNLLDENEVISKEYFATEGDSPLIDGMIKRKVYGFKIIESNLFGAQEAYFWHPSFMTLAVQKGASYKEMDLEPATKVPSVRIRSDMLFDWKLMDELRLYKFYNT